MRNGSFKGLDLGCIRNGTLRSHQGVYGFGMVLLKEYGFNVLFKNLSKN